VEHFQQTATNRPTYEPGRGRVEVRAAPLRPRIPAPVCSNGVIVSATVLVRPHHELKLPSFSVRRLFAYSLITKTAEAAWLARKWRDEVAAARSPFAALCIRIEVLFDVQPIALGFATVFEAAPGCVLPLVRSALRIEPPAPNWKQAVRSPTIRRRSAAESPSSCASLRGRSAAFDRWASSPIVGIGSAPTP